LAALIIYKYKSHPQIARFLFRNTAKKRSSFIESVVFAI
jgi:hypothetical protein